MDIIQSSGKLIFDPINRTKKHNKQSSWKRTAMIVINDDTYQYYQWLIEKRFPFIQGVKGDTNWLNPPLRGSHVTIINDKINTENFTEQNYNKAKKLYNGKEIFFFFNWEGLRNNGEHIYFKVECPMGMEIRKTAGLSKPYFDFHITIGLVPKESEIKKKHLLNVQNYMIKNY